MVPAEVARLIQERGLFKNSKRHGDYKGTFLANTFDIVPLEDGWHIFDVMVNDIVKTQMALHLSITRKQNEMRVVQVDPKAPQARKSFSHPASYARALETAARKSPGNTSSAGMFLCEL